MAESLLLPVVHSVAGKAASAFVQSVTRMWGVDADRDKLERRLLAVQSLLADAEAKSETNPAVRKWMKDLKAVAYQADDVLDDFQYEALRREAQRNRSMASKVLGNFTSNNILVFRHKVSRDLKNVLEKIDELVTEMSTFRLVERVEAPHIMYRETHSVLDESTKIFGREHDKEVVVELLLGQRDQQHLQVLPIIGMGGLGKTTLAKMVYNDCRVQKHFDLKIWHCVSENFSATAVVRSVIELATGERCDLPDTIELLQQELRKVVGWQRLLLIFDDVWSEEHRKWEDDLKPLLWSSVANARSGSMIIVTSRSRKVASIMGTHPPHELTCLREDESWELFSNKAFSKGVQENEEFITIGKRIVDKCMGLPLALKTMGGLMSSKQQAQEWMAIAESNLGDICTGKDEVLSILKLSYKHLSSEMKQCFSFCAIFLKDCEIEKDILIQLWIANGFLREEGLMDLEQKGEFVFNELIWRSFLQDVKFVRPTRHIFGSRIETDGCKMHDLMHDLARDVANECAIAEDIIQEKVSIRDVHHLHISSADELKQMSGLFKSAICLRTLLTPLASHKDLREVKLMSLRVLCCRKPSSSLVLQAKHLHYLDLSDSEIIKLPNSVCMLYNLQSLRLNNCQWLKVLPEGMRTMKKLRHLYLLGCHDLQRMPPKLSQLCNLHTLTTFIVGTGDGFGIEELKDLQQLGNRLELFCLRKVKSGSKANLHEKKNLSELLLDWGWGYRRSGFSIDYEVDNEEEVLESLVPHGELKILEFRGYRGLTISQWMRDSQMFQCLKELSISNCTRCKDIPVVWLSPSLEILQLFRMASLTTLCKNIDVEASELHSSLQVFPRLKRMSLDYLPNLERWAESSAGEPHSSVMFPRLEVLKVTACKKLANLPDSPLLTYLSFLGVPENPLIRHMGYANYCEEGVVPTTIPLGSWSYLVSLHVGLQVDMVMPLETQQGQVQILENLRHLRLMGDDGFLSVFSLSRLQQGLVSSLAFVEELEISSCSNIVHWPVEELQFLSHLRSLYIWGCKNLEGKVSSSEEVLPLPHLEKLSIRGCYSMLEIPKLPSSLEIINISHGSSLVALPSNLGNLAKLWCLSVTDCSRLKVLPDGMDGLISLKELTIVRCHMIVKFPQGLLQRLPALKHLEIEDSPNLQRCCGQGGECFDLISSIPHKSIQAIELNGTLCLC